MSIYRILEPIIIGIFVLASAAWLLRGHRATSPKKGACGSGGACASCNRCGEITNSVRRE